MLSNRSLNSSPVKQNISPQKFAQSPQKQTHLIKQLVNLLKQHNITVPPQFFQYIKGNSKVTQFHLNQIKCENEPQNKKLKIKLSDAQFQLKKIQEDFAQFKVLSRLQKQKLVKKYTSEIQILKKKIQDDNLNWQKRYVQSQNNFLQQKQVFQQILLKSTNQKLHQTEISLKNKYESILSDQENTIKDLQSKLKTIKVQMQKEKVKAIQICETKKQIQIKQIKSLNVQKQNDITQKLQNKIQNIKQQKKVQTQKLQQTINKLQKQRQSFTNQIYFLNKDKQELNLQIKCRQRKILQLEMAIRAKQQIYIDTQKQFQEIKLQIHAQHQEAIKKIQKNHAIHIKQIMSQHLDELDSYYERINKLQQRKSSIQDQYKEEMHILEHKFTERMSKTEDLEEIQRLKNIIHLKDREISRYQDDLKISQLQRQNNQKNYTRIFSSHSSRRKSSNSHRDKQSFFKQSNTTDLKMILKICNKEF